MRNLMLAGAMSLLGMGSASAAPVIWTDWTSGTAGSNGIAAGVLNIGATTVNVNYSGQIAFIQTNGGTNYWAEPNPASMPYTSAVVDNAPPASDIIALSTATSKTLTFSQAVDNLFFAVVSLNGNGYQFNQDFDVVSYGQGYWGGGVLTKTNPALGVYQLNGVSGEPHGVIRFHGSISSITWTSLTAENWNGFTVGTYGLAASVPEPSTMVLALLGLPLLRFAPRRR